MAWRLRLMRYRVFLPFALLPAEHVLMKVCKWCAELASNRNAGLYIPGAVRFSELDSMWGIDQKFDGA